MQPSIRVENLSKRYRLGTRGGYRTLRESVSEAVAAPFRRLAGRASAEPIERESREWIWAIKDVSFEASPGDVVGVIGRNGSGKSTLLKILSRVTEPTEGSVRLCGRVGSLLEVGTGFHQELTGRENIFLSGTIVGMSRKEIARKLDEIVEFSEIGAFLDTPVKRYSSGMYVRLAFAVSAHLETEILIVDEVLAVGDVAFQKKCLAHLQRASQSGRIILLVSHNMSSLQALCNRAVLLAGGRVHAAGEFRDVMATYYRSLLVPAQGASDSTFDAPRAEGMSPIFRSATIVDDQGRTTNFVPLCGIFRLQMTLDLPALDGSGIINVGIDDLLGQRMITIRSPLESPELLENAGKVELECRVDELPLAPGDYWIKVSVRDRTGWLDAVEQAVYFTVGDGEVFDEGRRFLSGRLVVRSRWEQLSRSVEGVI